MFTGIVEKIGTVKKITPKEGGIRISVSTPFEKLDLGESICTSGVCLTVESFEFQETVFFLSDETLERTRFKGLRLNDSLNLERAVTPSTRLSGHYVQGHVDGVGIIQKIEEKKSGARLVQLSLPPSLMKYCVIKGSITIDGVSLTINDIPESREIDLMIIPHTWKMTSFQYYAPGTAVNVENDILAKYVEKLCHH